MGNPSKQRKSRAECRFAILTYLGAQGDVRDDSGRASTHLREASGFQGTGTEFAQLLAAMEGAGEIERVIRGRRTYEVRLPQHVRDASADPKSMPASIDAERRSTTADLDAAIDYDALARSLFLEVIRRLSLEGQGLPRYAERRITAL